MTDQTVASPNLRKAIIVKLQGGLGNQIFQYMAGRALSDLRAAPLYCLADEGNVHASQLELVGLTPAYVSLPDYMIRRGRKRRDSLPMDFVRSTLKRWPVTPVREPHFHYWDGLFDQQAGCLLTGYWQSHKYLEKLTCPVNELIDINGILQTVAPEAQALVEEGNTVCVHIRRGDYLKEPSALAVHGIIGPEYYERARTLMDAVQAPTRYLVFSDDTALAREALGHWPNTTFMDRRRQEQDLALMSRCRHHIIANSSFSWWGATLASHASQTVVAPRYWFTPQALRKNYVLDLLPDDWVLL